MGKKDWNETLQEANDNYALRTDATTTANVTYVGKAKVGTATSADQWQIQRIDETSDTVITWADGDDKFNNVWDDRASLSYS